MQFVHSVSKGYPKVILRDTTSYSQGLMLCARHVMGLQVLASLWISEENLSGL